MKEYSLPIQITHHSFFFEIYSHCGDELGTKCIVYILVEKTGLTHTWITCNYRIIRFIAPKSVVIIE